MARELILLSHSWRASADLSSYIYYAVQLDSNGEVALANATSETLGILQNAPDAQYEEAEVGMIGFSKAKAGGTISIFDKLAPDANGKLAATTTDGDDYVAVALEAAVENDVFQVFLVPFGVISNPS